MQHIDPVPGQIPIFESPWMSTSRFARAYPHSGIGPVRPLDHQTRQAGRNRSTICRENRDQSISGSAYPDEWKTPCPTAPLLVNIRYNDLLLSQLLPRLPRGTNLISLGHFYLF
jgi:hypothetical protein